MNTLTYCMISALACTIIPILFIIIGKRKKKGHPLTEILLFTSIIFSLISYCSSWFFVDSGTTYGISLLSNLIIPVFLILLVFLLICSLAYFSKFKTALIIFLILCFIYLEQDKKAFQQTNVVYLTQKTELSKNFTFLGVTGKVIDSTNSLHSNDLSILEQIYWKYAYHLNNNKILLRSPENNSVAIINNKSNTIAFINVEDTVLEKKNTIPDKLIFKNPINLGMGWADRR